MGKTDDSRRRAPSSEATTGTTTTTTTTTTTGAATAVPSPAGGANEQVQKKATTTATTTTTTTATTRGACTPSPLAFWIFAGLGWLDFLIVAIFVTPGNDWLRLEGGGQKVGWFEIGGGSGQAVSDSCDAGVLGDAWCKNFEAFQILQVAATASISAAALVLLLAVCRPRPRRWGIASSIFFFLYAIMQGVVVWLVVDLRRDLEDAPEEIGSETGLFASYPVNLDYGITSAVAFYAGVGGFNEGLLLLAFAKHSGKGRSLKDAIPVPSRDPAAAQTHPRAASADVEEAAGPR